MGRAEIRRFQRASETAAAFLKGHLTGDSRVKVITHTDSDGIAAGAILARCLYSYNVPFHIKFTRPLKPEEIAELGKEDYDLFVFMDQGTGQIAAIHKFILGAGRDVLILDHHPGEFPELSNLAYLNPHACGLNGAKDVGAAGTAYLAVENIDKNFRSLIGLAIVGALGDRQEFFSGFTGANEVLVKRAIDLGLIRTNDGLKLVGRELSPAVECLRLCIRPYLPNLSGNLSECRELIGGLGISLNASFAELGSEIERKVRDAICAKVGQVATNEEFCHTLWGMVYELTTNSITGPRDVREYSAMLDACGRLRKPEIGFAAALGDRAAYNEARGLLSRYLEQMMRTLSKLNAQVEAFKVTPRMRYIYTADEIEPTMIGEAISLAMESGLVAIDKPVVGIVDGETGDVKISARATPGLAMQGLNVGDVLSRVAADVGGSGGGHDVAAAARVPRERMDEFIAKLDQALTEAGGT